MPANLTGNIQGGFHEEHIQWYIYNFFVMAYTVDPVRHGG